MSATLEPLNRFRIALSSLYTIERELGRGGMATVFLALDRKHGRNVALKVLHPDVACAANAERFLREIRLTAQLAHPHILPLLDSGEAEGLPYYAMPVVEGGSLRERLRREERMPLGEAIAVACEVADGLAYAHRQGVLHRDIKPENIMLSGGHAIVADFGIAKALRVASDEDTTQAGVTVGTPTYMSPEQAAGERAIDGRTDIYSLGVVLYEMLAGVVPYVGTTSRRVIAQRFTGPVPAVRDARPDVPLALDETVTRALALDPDGRFASADDLVRALTEASRLVASHDTLPNPVHPRPRAERDESPSLAVLPFENLGADPENEYLSDGITEEILTTLSRLGTIRICARPSSFAFKGKQTDVREIGRLLGVKSLLLGSIRRAGNRLRITAQLVDAGDGFQRWSERYERRIDDVFAIQDEIAAAIVRALNATLVDSRAFLSASPPTGSVEAYDAFLQGRHDWNRRTEEGANRAIESFRRAVSIDPGYSLGYAGLADVWATRAIYGSSPPREAFIEARRAAEAALAITPSLAEARTTLALVTAAHDWDWTGAEQMFGEAIAINPNYTTAHQWLASMCLSPHGRVSEAVDAMHRALELDPLSVVLRATLSSILLYGRHYEDAVTAAEAALEIHPGFAIAHYFIGQALVQLGRVDEGIVQAERASESAGRNTETLAALGNAYAVAGDATRARAILGTLETQAKERYVAPTHLAQVHLGLGELDRALDYLEEAAVVRAPDLVWVGVRPSYDVLRGQTRYARLLEHVGLRQV